MPAPLHDRLMRVGLQPDICLTYERKRLHSASRLDELRRRIGAIPSVREYPNLAIYAAGSHGRGDASTHSDVDLFFIHDDRAMSAIVEGPRVRSITIMAGIVQEMEAMMLPSPSNDGEYLSILSLSRILEHLGGAQDDHLNHFTARMLLILESSPTYGEAAHGSAVAGIMDAYLRDYEDHAEVFRPTFLVNDILRFWKTLCLNYENRRNQANQANRIKQKIRNFKLGHSRLLTCFATVALLSSYNNVSKEELIHVCGMSPIERLLELHDRQSEVGPLLVSVLDLYHWFLQKTDLPFSELERYFSDREHRVEAFLNARNFGDQIFRVVKETAERTGTFRYLVV